MKKVLKITVLLLMVLSLVGCLGGALGLMQELAVLTDATMYSAAVMIKVNGDASITKNANSYITLNNYPVDYDGIKNVTGTLHLNASGEVDKINFTKISPKLSSGAYSIKYDVTPDDQDLIIYVNGKRYVFAAANR